jgi:hypothetical protein
MRKSSGLKSVRQRLNSFAIATILAVGLLGLAWPAEAEIIYTKVKVKIPANSSYNLDVNNDGVTDFIISTSYEVIERGPGGTIVSKNFAETPASGNGAEGSPPPARLIASDQIGPSQTFYGGTGTLASLSESCHELVCGYSASGNWLKEDSPEKYVGRSGFLGLSFQINGETYYGWVYLSVSPEGNNPFVTLNGYAYETTPGMPIKAGQTTGGSSALSPGPANRDDSGLVASVTNPTQAVTLGTLEVGARDVPLLRRKESAGAAPENI